MTNAEYEKLVSTYGEDFTNQCITILDNYKGSSGKKYKSDYRAILNWVIDRVKQQNNKKANNGIDDFKEMMEDAINEQARDNSNNNPFSW